MIVQMPLDVWQEGGNFTGGNIDAHEACKRMILSCGDQVVQPQRYDAALGGTLLHLDMPKFKPVPRYQRCIALLRDLPKAESSLAVTLPPLRREGRCGGFRRLSLNGFWWDDADHGLTFTEDPSRLRWVCEKQGIAIEGVKPRNKRALLILQKFMDSSVRVDMAGWAKAKTAQYLNRGYAVTVRTHPHHTSPKNFLEVAGAETQRGETIPLRKALEGIGVVIAHTSTAAVDAAVAGYHVDTDPGNMAAPVSSWPPARDQWLASIAHTQWTLDEIKTGKPWNRLRELL